MIRWSMNCFIPSVNIWKGGGEHIFPSEFRSKQMTLDFEFRKIRAARTV